MDGATSCGPNAARCHALAAIVTDVVLTLARERAVDGYVALDDIERIADLVRRGTITLDEALRVHEEKCRKEYSRPKGTIGARSNPFQRLMVRPFETLLTEDPPVLLRGHLENYFEYLGHVFGPRIEKFERHCRAIVQALLVIHGNNLTWDHYYVDPRTAKTLDTALKVLTHSLHTPEGQRLWYGCMSRPAGDLPTPPMAGLDRILQTLLETGRGFAAAAD